MLRLARISIARPRAALLSWGVIVIALSVVGLGVAHSLSPSIVVVPGTESSRAQRYADAHFGAHPARADPAPGARARSSTARDRGSCATLVKRPHTRALSAWDAGAASQGLRPEGGRRDDRGLGRPARKGRRQPRPAPDRTARGARRSQRPVRASVTGQPSIDRALKDAGAQHRAALRADRPGHPLPAAGCWRCVRRSRPVS